jgi:hypothetical protein
MGGRHSREGVGPTDIGATVLEPVAPKFGGTGHYDRRCPKSVSNLREKV